MASGRSSTASKRLRPRKRWRTSTMAQMTPKTVLHETAMVATRMVSHRACRASGVVTACQAAPTPSWKARAKTMATGKTSKSARYPRAANRRPSLAVMPPPPPVERVQRDQDEQRERQQQHRDRRRPWHVVDLDLVVDKDRGDLGLVRQVPGDEHDRAELSHGAGEAQGGTREYGWQQVGEDDPPEGRERARPERVRRLFHLAVQLRQNRLYGTNDERKRDEKERHHYRRSGVGDVEAKGALGSVERQQRQAGDDRGQGERKVDQGVDQPFTPESIPYQHPGDKRPRHDVDGHDDQRGPERQFQRRDRLRVGDGEHEAPEAVAEGTPHHRRQRYEHDEAQVDDHGPTGEGLVRPGGAGPRGRRHPGVAGCAHSVGCPSSRLILAMTLVLGSSKNSASTFSHPPRLLMVNRSGGWGKSNSASTFSSTGR